MDIEITALQLRIDGDTVKDHFASQLEEEAHSDYGEPYTEMELDSDGELRVITTIHHTASMMIDEIEEAIRTGYLVDMSTGDFDEPGLCGMDKRQEMSGGDYLFSYNVPESVDELNAQHEGELQRMRNEMDLLRKDRDEALNRASQLELVRQWFAAAQHNAKRAGASPSTMLVVDREKMATLLDLLRWGDTEAVVPHVRELIKREIEDFSRRSDLKPWTTPTYRTEIPTPKTTT